jgi:hypothetical protein
MYWHRRSDEFHWKVRLKPGLFPFQAASHRSRRIVVFDPDWNGCHFSGLLHTQGVDFDCEFEEIARSG